MVVLYILHFN